jgi:hypothetical protein
VAVRDGRGLVEGKEEMCQGRRDKEAGESKGEDVTSG